MLYRLNEKTVSQNLEIFILQKEKSVLVSELDELKGKQVKINSNYTKKHIQYDSLAEKCTLESQNYGKYSNFLLKIQLNILYRLNERIVSQNLQISSLMNEKKVLVAELDELKGKLEYQTNSL